MRLTTKVALSLSIALFVAGILSFVYVMGSVTRVEREGFERTNAEALQLLALSVAPAVASGEHERAQAILDNIARYPQRYPNVVGLEIIDRTGRIVASVERPRVRQLAVATPSEREWSHAGSVFRRLDAHHLEIIVPIQVRESLGTIRARITEERLSLIVAERRNQAIVVCVIVLITLFIVLHLLLRRIVVRRIGALAGAVRGLRRGKMDVRAATDGRDEIAQLGTTFNEMADDLHRYTDQLEQLVAERTESLEAANKRLAELAITDPLTELFNRRHFEESAARDLEVARRAGRPFSIISIDVDHFKEINDRFGHPAGDAVLRAMSEIFGKSARSADLVARIGGEEFAIAMPDATAHEATLAAERVRSELARTDHGNIPGFGQQPVTASFGVAAYPEHGDSLSRLVSAADAALYRAKQEGRNRVVTASTKDRVQQVRRAEPA